MMVVGEIWGMDILVASDGCLHMKEARDRHQSWQAHAGDDAGDDQIKSMPNMTEK